MSLSTFLWGHWKCLHPARAMPESEYEWTSQEKKETSWVGGVVLCLANHTGSQISSLTQNYS